MLSFEEKIQVLNSFSELTPKEMSNNRINYKYTNKRGVEVNVIKHLKSNHTGYINVGYLHKDAYNGIPQKDGFLNIDRNVSDSQEFRLLVEKVIDSLKNI